MDRFSIGGAWSLGFGFVMQRLPGHALILIVMGIALPIGLEYVFLGAPIDSANPTMIGATPLGMQIGVTPLLLALMGTGFVLQTGSYFAVWRLGFRGSPVGAILYGLAAGLLALVIVVAAYFLAYYAAQPFLEPDTVFLAVLVFMLPLILVVALFFVSQAVMIAACLVLVIGFAMLYGAAYGQVGLAATLVGGSGSIAVLLLLLSGLMFWLAARMSCATALMAERGSLNLITAIRDSWRLTWEEQGPVTRYLALIGFVLALLIIGGSLAFGAGATSVLQSGAASGPDTGSAILRPILAVPLAFLTVLVPAGIYRQLSGTDEADAAEVFA